MVTHQVITEAYTAVQKSQFKDLPFFLLFAVVMQLSHCLKRRTSVNHLFQAASLVITPNNQNAYDCLQAVSAVCKKNKTEIDFSFRWKLAPIPLEKIASENNIS